MKGRLLCLSLAELCLLGSFMTQTSALASSFDLAGFVSLAEGGIQALNSANAAQSSENAASAASSVGLGGFLSVAFGGVSSLNSANSVQSSEDSARSKSSASSASAASAATAVSASRTSSSQSDLTSGVSSQSLSAAGSSRQTQARVTPSITSSGSSTASSPASVSASSTSTSSPTAAPATGGSGSNHHRTLIIVLSTVFGVLAIALIILALLCCCSRSRRHKRLSNRQYTPDEDEVDSWRLHEPAGPTSHGISRNSMQYAQVPAGPLSPTRAAFIDGGRPLSHPYPEEPPDMAMHPAMRPMENVHQNPFAPVPPPPRRGAPNARPGLTDASVPGDEPFVGASVVRPRSRSSSLLRRSNSQSRIRSGSDLRDSYHDPGHHGPGKGAVLGAGALGAAAGAVAMHHHNKGKEREPVHPTSIRTSDLPPAHSNRNSSNSSNSYGTGNGNGINNENAHGTAYRDSRPATPMALAGFGPSVNRTGEMNPYGNSTTGSDPWTPPAQHRHSHPLRSSPPLEQTPPRTYAPYHDYDYTPAAPVAPMAMTAHSNLPPPSPPRSPARSARRSSGTPPLVPSRSPKRVSFSSTPTNGSNSHSDSESTRSNSAWRMSQMPGSFDTPRSGPPTPVGGGYFPGSGSGNANRDGNANRRLRLSDLRQEQEREWYEQHHDNGYGVGTAM